MDIPELRDVPGPEAPATNGIVFFDFDNTLTQYHTGGELGVQYEQKDNEEVPILGTNGNPVIVITREDVTDVMGGEERTTAIIQLIRQVRNAGYLVYINTRGLDECCLIAFNLLVNDFVGRGRWIEGIVGAVTLDQIPDPYNNHFPTIESEDLWARRKTELMEMVTAYHGIYPENALFFDDTVLNVDYAKEHGFWRSFVVTPETVLRVVRDALSLPDPPGRYQLRRVIVGND